MAVVYGTWLTTTLFGVLALLALIALVVLASPLFAVLFVILALAFLCSLFVVLRAGRSNLVHPEPESGFGSPAGRDAGSAARTPRPRSGGAPASGEGA
jgi:hypothetical protein